MWVSLLTTYWLSVVQPPPLTCAGCAVPPCQTKKTILFVCLLWLFLPITVCVLSLSIPHGMHLVVPAHPYFFWVACDPSRTFPLKKPKQESQNRFFSLSLSLSTADHALWPMTHHFLYWLGIGWWCLGLACASPFSPTAHAFAVFWRLVCKFCCALLASYGVGCFSICHSLWLASFGDWALLDHGPSFPRLILCSLCGLVGIFLPYRSAIPAIMLLDSILLGLFGPAVYFLPSDSLYSLGLFLHYVRAPMSNFPLGLLWPICFP